MTATKFEKTVYWISTSLILLLMMFSFVAYHVAYDRMADFFTQFGYPSYIIYPLAYLKLVGAIVIVSNRYNNLKEMVYGAYFINMVLATAAHLSIGDTPYHAFVGLVAIPLSYFYSNRVRGRPEKNFLVSEEIPNAAK